MVQKHVTIMVHIYCCCIRW